jgi:tripeptide aminopeptidase
MTVVAAPTSWPSARTVRALARHPAIAARAAELGERMAEIRQAVLELAAIPAPTFAEQRRARWVADRLAEAGIATSADEAGNVIVSHPGEEPGVLVTAHLDTVFAETDDHTARAEGGVLRGRGIGDDTLGVVALIELARLFRGPLARRALWLAATTGEEGLGDLRGIRALTEALDGRLLACVAVEGHFYGRVVNVAVGSRRWRIAIEGRGGHSWHDHGGASAVHGVAQLAARLAALRLPRRPRTTLNVGRIGGGEGVNVLAPTAWMEVEVRSERQAALDAAATSVEAIAREVSRRSGLSLGLKSIGDRPAGALSPRHPLVRAAAAALEASGARPELHAASTDANGPLARGVPSVSVGVSRGAGMHTPDERVEETPIADGLRQLLYLVAALAAGPR